MEAVRPAMHKKHTFYLPFPPSANRYWRHNRGRTHLSGEARTYRALIAQEVAYSFCEARLDVSIFAHPPDKRKRDLDNMLKQLLDALQFAGAYRDDAQIDRLSIERREVKKHGLMEVQIQEIN